MEDKHRHLDSAFTDHAWSDMRRMLDEEMPVQGKRKKRFVWWWTLAAVALIGGVAAYCIGSENDAPKPVKKEIPIASTDTQNSVQENTVTQAEFNTSNQNESSPTDIKKQEKNQIVQIPTQTKKDIEQTGNQVVAQKENTLPLFESNSTKEEKTASELSVQTTEAILSERQNLEGKRSELFLVDKVNELPVSPLDIDASTPKIDVAGTQANKIELSAYSSAFFAAKGSGKGAGVGVLANVPIKNSNFSLQTGLGYAFYLQPLNVVRVYSQEDNSGSGGFNDPDSIETGANIGFGYNNLFVSYDLENDLRGLLNFSDLAASESLRSVRSSGEDLRMHYLQIPVELSYRYKRWRGFAGADLGILLASNSEFVAGGILSDEKSHEFYGGFDPNGNPTGLAQAQLRKFDFSATAGIGFDISPRLGLDLKYRRGYVDIIKGNNEKKDFNRFFQASIRYRLK